MSLPGHILDHKIDGHWTGSAHQTWGEDCDCCDKSATVVVQGETDSFGFEGIPFCEEHYQESKEPQMGSCDWCKDREVSLDKLPEGSYLVDGQVQHQLVPVRDYDEGTHGPVYYVCRPCKQKQDDRLRQEAAEDDYYDDYWYEEEYSE